MEIKLTLTLEEVNGLIGVLGMLPFNQIAGLVSKVRDQAIPQVQAAEAAAKAEAEAANEPADTEGGDAA
jgi:hypothetical protein